VRPGPPLLLSLCAALGSCALAESGCAIHPRDPVQVGPGGAESLGNPFAPASIRVHPLTHAERDSAGKVWIICHVELKDAWGDTTKGVGQLQVQLYRPSGSPGSGIGTQELKWDTNLSDLKNNAALYDGPTRTYRLPLENAPEWIMGEEGKEKPRVRLRAVLGTRGPAGEKRVLQDDYVMQLV
jgi:hypothetical protein